MVGPCDSGYIRYLSAKKSVDDRALNRQVFEALETALKTRQETSPLSLLEVGCGIGTMAERLIDWGILAHGSYTGLDLEPENIAATLRRLLLSGPGLSIQVKFDKEKEVRLEGGNLKIAFKAVDFYEFAAQEAGRRTWDIVLAHAFLDLVDLDTALPLLLGLLRPGGWFYFTLNFDGGTIFLPPLDPYLEARIEELYHRTMDERGVGGRPAGASRTGRRLFTALPRFKGEIIAAGSSDWVVFPGPSGYENDEAYFLHYLVDTVADALRGHPALPEAVLSDWQVQRHRQINQGQLIYIAHNLDFFGVKLGTSQEEEFSR
ncbi:MAG: methyltransferase [Desulfobacteraceae bacterium]